MSQLIAAGLPDTVLQRLAKRGVSGVVIGAAAPAGWNTLPSIDEAEQLAGERIWFAPSDRLPLLAPGDCHLDVSPMPGPGSAGISHVTLALQDSPFAVEHGFLLAVGGKADDIARIAHIADALAPMAGGWLHAGGLPAPHFMAQLALELGGGLGGVAAMMGNLHLAGLQPLLQGQQALLQRLGALANAYLAIADDEGYRPYHPIPTAFALGQGGQAPASQLAKLLQWMAGQANAPSSSQPTAMQ